MKPLKKHPKQQRMEEMNIPGSNKKPSRLVHKDTLSVFNDLDQDVQKDMLRSVRAIRKEKILYSGELKTRRVTNEEMTFPIIKPVPKGKFITRYKKRIYVSGGDESILIYERPKEKVTMTGREYLRSINDDNGFTLMPRLAWRVVAVGVLVGAVIYFLSKHGYIR